jgi:hypothetical protein
MATRWIKLIGLGLASAGAGYLSARARRKQLADAMPVAGEMIMDMGIAAVDPEPMTQVTGEGIDPDMDTALPDDMRAILDHGYAYRSRIP